MKVQAERIENSQYKLEVEVEPEQVAAAMDKAYRRVVGRVAVPGFRLGKAPRQVVERMVGREMIWQEALDLLVPEVYRAALAEAEIQPIGEPLFELVGQDPVVLKYTVPVKPEVELGDYRSIRVQEEPLPEIERLVQENLEGIQHQLAEWPLVERPAKDGDRLKADIEAWYGTAPLLYSTAGETLVKAGDAESFIDQKGALIQLSADETGAVPGFSKNLVGVLAGQVREFRAAPGPEMVKPGNEGREANFLVTVHEVQEERLPALDDELAQKVDWYEGRFETLAALTERVREQWQVAVTRQAKRKLHDDVVEQVVAQAKVELPPQLVDGEAQRLADEWAQDLKARKLSVEQWLKISGRNEDSLREEFRNAAAAKIKRALVLTKIATEERIVISDAEIDESVREMAERYGTEAQKLEETFQHEERRANLSFAMRMDKTIEWLAGLATEGEQAAEVGSREPEAPAVDSEKIAASGRRRRKPKAAE